MVFLAEGLSNWTEMQKILHDIAQLDHVRGGLVISADGQVLCSEFALPPAKAPESFPWVDLVKQLNGVKEADVIFSETRVYLRQSQNGYLVILMEPYAALAMIRLHCDVQLSVLQKEKSKGVRRFFKK